ncbi:CBS domain-containing protein [Candidatus Saccharibacteria bacterium]|jgi:CBS domain containing-hemolysin-like protein|nr:CBS domain-containing protein [Candidatus Saccharibacteria bacterium]
MEAYLLILAGLAYAGLIFTVGVQPYRSKLSRFELKRRQSNKEKEAEKHQLRERYYDDLVAWQRIISGLLLTLFVLLLVNSLGWVFGVLLAVLGVVEYSAIAKFPIFRRWSQKFYDKLEPSLLSFAQKNGGRLSFLRGVKGGSSLTDVSVGSREELINLVKHSGKLLNSEEKRLVESGLTFGSVAVADVMTPRSVIDSVSKDELLGPLILDELHKTGHSRFPVIDGDIDHVVGVLHLRNLISLKDKQSAKAGAAMKTPVFYIKDNQNLQHALAAFLKTSNLLFVVVNEYRETVGIITLEDVLEALLGRKIMDEFDAHEDLRAVAARNPKNNNTPSKHHDV